MIVINAFNYGEFASYKRFSRNMKPSVAVPDEGLSLRDLIDRHMKGGKVKTFTPVYDDGTRVPIGVERMDPIERQELANRLGDFVSTTRGRLISARSAARKAANDARVIADYEAKRAKPAEPVSD